MNLDFTNDLGVGIDISKPLHISIDASFTALSNLYSGKFPSGPGFLEYSENPAGIERARQVYEHLYREPTTIPFIRSIIRHGTYVSSRKVEPPFEEPPPEAYEEPVWDRYVITFDHLVPLGEENPEAVQLLVDDQLNVTRRNYYKDKWRINYTVKEIPGMPDDYYGRQALLDFKEGGV
jgi:hypothetical protein